MYVDSRAKLAVGRLNMANPFWDGAEASQRRVVYKGAGHSDADIRNKPHIGIANTFSEGSPAHIAMRSLAEAVKQGVWETGGVPVEFGVPSTCGNIAVGTERMRYELAGRDAVAMGVEFVASVHQFDGMVLMACCDNIIPGVIMGGIRTGIPSVVLTGGPMLPGMHDGRPVMTPDINVFGFQGEIPKDFDRMEDSACPCMGACPVMGTANTMQILAEALGMSLPGSAVIPAVMADRVRAARESGRAAVRLAKEGIRPIDIMTREAIDNAWPSTWPSAAPPTPSCTSWPSPMSWASPTRWTSSTGGAISPASAASNRPDRIRWWTCTTPAACRRCRRSSSPIFTQVRGTWPAQP